MAENPVGNIRSQRIRIVASGAEMNSAVDARILDFIASVGKVRETAGDASQRSARYISPDSERRVFTEGIRENRRRGAAGAGVAGRIFGEGRCDDEGRPIQVGCDSIESNRSHWPPKVEVALRFPARDD